MASRQWRPSRAASSSDQSSGKGQWQHSQQKEAPSQQSPRSGDARFARALRNGGSSRDEASQAQATHLLVPYLPQDDAAAAGLSVEQGAVDPVQTQQVADIFNAELSALLKLTPREFWRRVTMDTTIHVSLGSYLQFRRRWYDFYLNRPGNALGLIVGDQEMHRHVFMVLFRMSSNVEPGFSKTDCLSSEEHADILQKKQLFDIPKLLDICAIYGHDNPDLTHRLVNNVFSAHQRLNANLADVVPTLSNTVDTVHQRCFATLSMLLATSNMETSASVKLQQELLEVLQYVNDTIFSLQSFIEAYPSGVLISLSTGQSNSKEQLLPILAVIHDSLLPIIQRSLSCLGVANSKSTGIPVEPCFKRIRLGLLELVWRLLVLSYLSESNAADSMNAAINHLQKGIICDPSARGEAFVQIVSNMVAGPFEGSSGDLTEGLISTGALLRNVERKHKILDRVDKLCSTGLISLDSAQYDYVVTLIRYTGPSTSQTPDISRIALEEERSIQMQESDIMYESKISHIKDILPDYGNGFIAACLEAYDNNPEEVIQRILENTLHPSLQSLDKTLQLKPDSLVSSISKKDKGKGKAIEEIETPSSELQNSKSLNNTSRDLIRNGPSSSLVMANVQSDGLDQRLSSSVLAISSSSRVPSTSTEDMKGRFVWKERGDGNATKLLDERDAEDASRIAAYAAQYDDEYDDSFDELGTHFADAVEETESLADLIRSKSSTGGSANVPQSSKIPSRPRPEVLHKVTRVSVDASISKDEMQGSNNQKAFFGKGNGNRFSDTNRTASSQTNRGRGRGRRDENRGQYFVKDGKNYSYKVSGSVGVSSVEEAEALKKVEEETLHGLGRGGNAPSSVQQTSGGRNMPGSEFGRSSRPVQNEFAGRGRPNSQGRGFPRKDHDSHHRKDRAMKKHFASVGGL